MYTDASGLLFRPAMLAAGLTEKELRRLRADGRLTTVRPGVFVPADDPRDDDPTTWHALAVRAAVGKVAADAVVSHVSAAVLHGLTVWGCPLGRVHVTRPQASGGRRTRRLHVHAAALAPDEVVEIAGVRVTSTARTVVDLARDRPFEQALVTADAALFRNRVIAAELAGAAAAVVGRTGSPNARRVVAAASGLSESPGETRSRVALARAGIPAPVQQYRVRGLRADFGWEQFRTVGEFDGKVKYGRGLRPGQDPGDAVFAEKRREDALRDEGLQVVRWVWAELETFDVVAARLWRAFDRGRR